MAKLFICPTCGLKFKNQNQLMNHIKAVHPVPTPIPEPIPIPQPIPPFNLSGYVGTFKWAVIVGYTNGKGPEDTIYNFSPARAKDMLFGTSDTSMASMYRKASNGSFILTGNILGPYNYNPNEWPDGNAFWNHLISSGELDISVYDLVSFNIYPGGGFFGGYASPYIPFVSYWSAHEFGHGLFLLGHSNSYNSDGSVKEYGDTSDWMGSISFFKPSPLLNAPHKIQMGWMMDTFRVTQTGRYSIGALELLNTGQPRTIIARKPGTAFNYYISYKLDEFFTGYGGSVSQKNTVQIHEVKWMPHLGYTMTVFWLSNLHPGQSFRSVDGTLAITVISCNSQTATVDLEINGDQVIDTQPPFVKIVKPFDNGITHIRAKKGTDIPITVYAWDETKIDYVEIIDSWTNQVLAHLIQEPYSFLYRIDPMELRNTIYLKAMACDTSGNQSEGNVIQIKPV